MICLYLTGEEKEEKSDYEHIFGGISLLTGNEKKKKRDGEQHAIIVLAESNWGRLMLGPEYMNLIVLWSEAYAVKLSTLLFAICFLFKLCIYSFHLFFRCCVCGCVCSTPPWTWQAGRSPPRQPDSAVVLISSVTSYLCVGIVESILVSLYSSFPLSFLHKYFMTPRKI